MLLPHQYRLPPRPHISFVAWGFASGLVAARMATMRTIGLSFGQAYGVLSISILVIVCCVLILVFVKIPRRRVSVCVVVVAMILMAWLSSANTNRTLERGEFIQDRPMSSLEFEATDDAGIADEQGRIRVQACEITTKARVLLEFKTEENSVPRLGETFIAYGSWAEMKDSDWTRSQLASGICASGVVYGWDSPRQSLNGFKSAVLKYRRKVVDALGQGGSKGSALLAGITTGDDTMFSSLGMRDVFARCGLSHMVAVSGTHLVLVGALLSVLLSTVNAKWTKTICIIMGSGLFVIFTGFKPSAVRAWVMAICVVMTRVVQRRPHGLSALGLTGLLLLVLDPTAAFSLSFLLSAASLAGIMIYMPWVSYHLVLASKGRFKKAAEIFALTLTAQISTFPITVPTFGSVSLVAPLANLIVTPLFTVLMTIGLPVSLLSGAFGPWMFPLVKLCALLGDGICAVTTHLASWSYASIYVVHVKTIVCVLCITLIVLYAAWPELTVRGLCRVALSVSMLGVCYFGYWRFMAPPEIIVLDIGQGDSILVRDRGSTLLVDTSKGDQVVDALLRNHVYHLDCVQCTHTDMDHIGGLKYLKGFVDVSTVQLAKGVYSAMPNEYREPIDELVGVDNVEEVLAGDEFDVGRFHMNVVWPISSVSGSDNEDSIVVLVNYSDNKCRSMSAYLTGDAESSVMQYLMDSGNLEDVDFYNPLLESGYNFVSITKPLTRL